VVVLLLLGQLGQLAMGLITLSWSCSLRRRPRSHHW
jgi:hypothetical protein